ncbi:OB-fold domain-containing protein [Variovorax sp. J22R24]|uniref:Zn-ribbon domain-containing OB-fold protein n=1 Tax=Variovorax gracilis TaxID=3053502 RepID=UPI002576C2FD|nr:OB-fold domain-containing protein [Variovorax sp. J22R24]MDM0106580.1 OB-fold domain-containing protein [Variovorax sp. J22R24]
MTQQSMSETYTKPLPKIDSLTRPYWDHAKKHELSVQRCTACGDCHFPPGPVCPVCLSDDQEWQVVSGRGTLVSWGKFHKAYWSGFADELPYNVCLVRLEEGPLIVSNFREDGGPPPKVGMEVRAVFDDVTEEVSLVRFTSA